MNPKLLSLCAASVLLASASVPAFAQSGAKLEFVEGGGTVMAGQGARSRPIEVGAKLPVGELVYVPEGSFATIRYPDGCEVPVEPGTPVTVLASPPCVPAGGGNTAAGGGGRRSIPEGAKIAGAGVLGAAAGIAIYDALESDGSSGRSGDGEPVSP